MAGKSIDVRFVLVDSADLTTYDDLNKGEACVYRRSDKTHGLVLACPICGHAGGGPHKYDPFTKSLKPSIRCGRCKFHGHLRNGAFSFA